MAYEIFGHAGVPKWMEQPVLFPLVCLLTAATGTLAVHGFKTSFVAVAVTMAVSIGILRMFRVHMPPALAVGLLPFVMVAPNAWYPVSVTMGTTALTLCTVGYGYLRRTSRPCRTARAELNP
jgi:CBS-domain-containing membrane protein